MEIFLWNLIWKVFFLCSNVFVCFSPLKYIVVFIRMFLLKCIFHMKCGNCIICCHYCHLSVINDVPSSFLRSQMGGSSQRPSFSSILSPQIFLLFPLGALCCTWDPFLMHIVWREVVMEALNNIWYLWAASCYVDFSSGMTVLYVV